MSGRLGFEPNHGTCRVISGGSATCHAFGGPGPLHVACGKATKEVWYSPTLNSFYWAMFDACTNVVWADPAEPEPNTELRMAE